MGPTVRVRIVSRERTVELALEDYVAGVVAAEAGAETEVEALRAQAVLARTFALKNLGRHTVEGYDFCSTTHCQRFTPARNVRAAQAAQQTRGEVALDADGRLIEAYYHASCGGHTADIRTLWGAKGPSYLRGVRDPFCLTMPRREWTERIAVSRLETALLLDQRTRVEPPLRSLSVVRRDATGRVERLAIEGRTRRIVSGWDFKLIIGRALGWQHIKSSRFDLFHDGAEFIFRGGGFGHGLGLCQEGAHVMARRGSDHRQIIGFYFPGAKIAQISVASRQDLLWTTPPHGATSLSRIEPWSTTANSHATSATGRIANALTSQRGACPGRVLSAEGFRLCYGPRTDRRLAERTLHILETARAELGVRLRAAYIARPRFELDVFLHDSTGDFVGASGKPPWAAAATMGHYRMDVQPVALLERRGVLRTTLRHEYAHAVIDALGDGRAPLFLSEGLAIHFAGEAPSVVKHFDARFDLSEDELNRRLAQPSSDAEMRRLYALAYKRTHALIMSRGEETVWRMIAGFRR